MVKPGYKQTEVGVIPEDWRTPCLSEVLLRVANGFVYKTGKSKRYPVTRIETIAESSIDMERVGFAEQTRDIEKYRMQKGDILYSHINSVDHIGKVAFYDARDPLYHGMNLLLLRTNANVCSRFVYFYLGSSFGRKKSASLAKQAVSQASINTSELKEVRMPLPSDVSEQQAIASALSDADELIESLEKLLNKKRQIKQGTMQELLTGKKRLPGFSGEWEVKRLGDVGKCLRGVSYRGDSDLSTHDTVHTKRLLRSNNVQNAIIVTDDVQFVNSARVSAHQILKQDDILVCMANGSKALVGKAGLFMIRNGCDYTFGAFMGCFRTESNKAVSAFIFSLFQTSQYRDYINNLLAGSSINNLRPSSIESLDFSVPSLTEQTAIAEVLSDMDAEIEALETKLTKARQVKQGMMQELLTGRIRLV